LPEEFLDRTSLLGTTARIAERMREYADAGVTTLALALPDSVPLSLRLDALHIGAAAYEKSGVSEVNFVD
jgi:alkanesulfonate monooxygenase SsuD/methylene tetrahydromethanopterin reductase-like flavin-dependent oxidoreductase (luciferase family)